MSTVLTNKFRIHNAESFKEGFSETEGTNIYMSLGKVAPWSVDDVYSGSSNLSSDINPPNPLDTVQSRFQSWRNMISAKRVQSSDVSFVIPRIDWTSGTTYTQYSDLSTTLYIDTSQNPFYVLTDDFNVYKCLFNNNGQASTTKPEGTTTDGLVETNDGYVWKYMYTISSTDAYKFVTPNFIPVKFIEGTVTTTGSGFSSESIQSEVQQNAVDGEISIISRDLTYGGGSLGSGYSSVSSVSVNTASITYDSVNDRTSIQLTSQPLNQNNDYYKGSSVYFSSPGTGKSEVAFVVDEYSYASAESQIIYLEGDQTSSFESGIVVTFDILPTVQIDGDGQGALAIPVLSGSGIDKVKVINGGSGYTKASISFTNLGTMMEPPQNVPTVLARFNVNISPKGGHGSNAVQELGGFFVMINTKFNFDEHQITTNNDFRQVSLIRNPKAFVLDSNGDLDLDVNGNRQTVDAIENAYIQTQVITLKNEDTSKTFTNTKNADFIVKDVSNEKNNAVIVDVIEEVENNLTVKKIRVSNVNGSFSVDQDIHVMSGQDVISEATVDSIKYERLEPYSGEVLFIEQRSPVTRDKNQIEDIKIILEF